MVGFDRRLKVEWLDAIATKQAAGASVQQLRKFGQMLLKREYGADEARRKTLTVLLHLWVNVPKEIHELRDRAAELLRQVDHPQRIGLHWGLALATYPFFRDAADAAGRLLMLQDSVSLVQLKRRLAERWGQRELVERATRHIARSWIDWGVLKETSQRGTYAPSRRIEVSGVVASWIVEALLIGTQGETVARIQTNPCLFPFHIHVSLSELRRSPRLVFHRQGVDQDVVAFRDVAARKRGQLEMF
jgi:hypothetical protein